MLSRFNNQGPVPSKSEGFTLIEMIVVIAIFGIVTTILLANLPIFRDRTSLDLVAQEVAINIRGAQVFGGSGRVGRNSGEAPTYGIRFNGPAAFILYRDLDNSDQYTPNPAPPAPDAELQQTYTLTGGFIINNICIDIDDCVKTLDILFTRPRLEPDFFQNGQDITPNKVEIIIQSLRSKECRAVTVWNNGQIAVMAVTDDTPVLTDCANRQPSS